MPEPATPTRVRIQREDFDVAAELAALHAGDGRVGAVCSFVGTVRDRNEGDAVSTMELEHYPGMTEKAIAGIVEEAVRRWSLADALVIHRHGRLGPGEAIMMVATAALHRGDAFAAAEFLMDYLKSRAPFWKKEIGADGAEWVAAKDADEDALKRW